MKLLLFWFTINCSWLCLSQSKDTIFIIRYHQNKKIATKEVKLSNEQNWGYAKAFDQQGNEIYIMHTRNVAGHASVEFIYYPSGAVSKRISRLTRMGAYNGATLYIALTKPEKSPK